MIINVANVKALLGISVTTWDARIALQLPIILESIADYCNTHFIQKGRNEYIYESGTLTFATTKVTHATDITFAVGDWIRIYNTDYNNGLYQIKSISGSDLTIETSKEFRVEVVSAYIALVKFPDTLLQVVANMVNKTIVNDTNGVKSEQIDDLKLEYFSTNTVQELISQNSSILNNYRLLYPKRLGVDIIC